MCLLTKASKQQKNALSFCLLRSWTGCDVSMLCIKPDIILSKETPQGKGYHCWRIWLDKKTTRTCEENLSPWRIEGTSSALSQVILAAMMNVIPTSGCPLDLLTMQWAPGHQPEPLPHTHTKKFKNKNHDTEWFFVVSQAGIFHFKKRK